MTSPYYKSTSKGYVLTHREPPANVDPSKRLEVYRVVSQFMNLEQRQEQAQTEKLKQTSKIYVDMVEPTAEYGSLRKSETKYLTRNPSIVMEKEDIKSVYTVDQSPTSTCEQKEKQRSMTHLKLSGIETSFKGYPKKETQIDAKTEGITAIQSSSHRKIITFELEKERILRRNLEKSYENLLNNLRDREVVFAFDHSELRLNGNTFDQRNHINQYASTQRINAGTPQNGEVNLKYDESIKRRNSCCIFKEAKNSKRKRSEEEQFESESCHSSFQSLSLEERMEKMRLRKEMMALEMRIQEMDNVILRKELKCKDEWKNRITLELENQSLKKQLENQKLKVQVERQMPSQGQEGSGLAKKEHLNYIFTIVMMFLCLAMVVKNKQ